MCYFCNAQLFEITHVANIKSTLVQHSCRNAEVVEAFCRVAASRSDTRRSIHWPSIAALHAPAEMSTALSSVPHSARCLAGANFPRLRALALFGRRPVERADRPSLPASKNQHNGGHTDGASGRALG